MSEQLRAAPVMWEQSANQQQSNASRKRTPLGKDQALELVRDALDHKRGLLAFQPVFTSGHRSSPAFYEGLIRVFTRDAQLISAQDFITLVEPTVTGREIDCLSLELTLRTLAENPSLRLSVNMSARSIGYRRWTSILHNWINRDPMIGERLILEISERSVMQLPELVATFMRESQAHGIAFAMDYFGSGEASLKSLRQLPFDIMKFDAEFSMNIATNQFNQTMLRALLFVAQNFDMLTVAVAVENEEDAQYLTEIEVDCLQGYHLGAPTMQPPWSKKKETPPFD